MSYQIVVSPTDTTALTTHTQNIKTSTSIAMLVHHILTFLAIATIVTSEATHSNLRKLSNRSKSRGKKKGRGKQLFSHPSGRGHRKLSKVQKNAVTVHPYNNNVMIYGSGNTNGEFSTYTNCGVELGLRVKAWKEGNLDSFEGQFLYNTAEWNVVATNGVPPRWNIDFTVNTESPPLTFLSDYMYELGIDTDPSKYTDFTIKLDVVNIPGDDRTAQQAACLEAGFTPDHALGTGTTDADPGYNCVQRLVTGNVCTTYACDSLPDCCELYLNLLDVKTVLQNSLDPALFVQFGLSSDPSVQPEVFLQPGGIFDIYWAAFDKQDGDLVGKVQIRVHVDDTFTDTSTV